MATGKHRKRERLLPATGKQGRRRGVEMKGGGAVTAKPKFIEVVANACYGFDVLLATRHSTTNLVMPGHGRTEGFEGEYIFLTFIVECDEGDNNC